MLIAEFELKGLPDMKNRQRGWKIQWLKAKEWKHRVALECRRLKISGMNLPHAKLTLTRISTKEPDFDGLVSGFKNCIDSLVEEKVLQGDKPSQISPNYKWQLTSPGKGRIVMSIET